jgi:hypothetical protein
VVPKKDGGPEAAPETAPEAGPERRPVGRPPHRPTEERRRHVEGMASRWLNQQDIAAILGICETTLRKHYAEELRRGTARGNLRLTERFRDKLDAGDTASIIWATKSRLGWSERIRQDVSVAGGPIDAYLRMGEDELRRRLAEIDEVLGEG